MSCKCGKSFSDFIIGSPETVQINALLEPSTDYLWEAVDSFGNIYHQAFTTDSNGIGTFDMDTLPDGFANASQAPLKLRIKQDAFDCDYIPLVMVQKFFEASISFRSGNTAVKDWVGCTLTAPTPSEHVVYSDYYSDAYL